MGTTDGTVSRVSGVMALCSIDQHGRSGWCTKVLARDRSLILRLLTRKVGAVPDHEIDRLTTLSLAQLEALGEALLDFGSIADLTAWLDSAE
jgi:hypothetical protein